MNLFRSLTAVVTGIAFLSAQTQVIAQDASANAKNTAATIAQGLQGTINSTVTDSSKPNSVAGYDSSQSLSQGQYFNAPDTLGGAGTVAAQSSQAYSIGTATLPVTADTKNLDVSAAKLVEANPTAYTGVSTSGLQGSCQAITSSASTGSTYYDSCHIGSTETDSAFSCSVGWSDVVTHTYSYSCEKKTVWGLNTKTVAGVTTTTKTNVGTVSTCAQLENLSYCTNKSSSTAIGAENYGVAGDGANYAPPVIQFPSYSVDTTSETFGCSQAVSVSGTSSPSYSDWSSVNAQGTPTIGAITVSAAAQQTGATSVLASSTVDDSACQAQIGTISCPSGSTLQSGQCVSTVAATPNYTCPSGWSLSGTTCTLQQASGAAVSGYSCPANYTLSGSSCTSIQPAGVSGYTCPSGYTLSGTTCTMVLTQAAGTASYSCPSGFTLSGSVCYKSDTQPANTSYSCPSGYALSGTTCTMSNQSAAIVSYTCPSGWTMNGNTCQQHTTYQAQITYTCPSTWTLNGSTCSSSSTYAASLIYTCPSGWSVQGSSCVNNYSYAPNVSYSCPAGWALSGSQCSMTSSYPATVTYSCGSGWSLSGSSCSQSVTSTPSVSYYCPSGWTQNGSTCTQSYSYTTTQTSCPSGGTISNFTFSCHDMAWMMYNPNNNATFQWGDSTDCGSFATQSSCHVKSNSGSYKVSGPTNIGGLYSSFWETDYVYECSGSTNYGSGSTANFCINGSTICFPAPGANNPPAPIAGSSYSGATCTVNNSQAVNSSYSCPQGMTLSGQQCVGTSTQAANANYSCADGSAPVGGTCYIHSNQAATASYSCPAGGAFDGSACQVSQSQAAAASYTCPSGGSLTGTTCVVTNSQAASVNYACPEGGTLNGTVCDVTNMQAATPVYGCPTGSTLSGTMCITVDNQPALVNYACPSNYQLQGTNCVLSESTNATPILACPNGYTLSGSTCTETLTLAATEHFACASGYTLSGSTCTSTVGASIDGYSCPAGYTLSGTTCIVSATQAAAFSYSCPTGAVLSGTNCVTTTAPQSSTGLTCQTPVETCTDPSPTTRMVDGVSVSHSCWAWNRSYQCAKLTPANDCASLQSQSNCKFDHEECLDDNCMTKSEVYLCTSSSTTGTSQATACSGDLYCIDGSCTQVQREASPDFANALTAINAMGDATTQFDPNSLTIFGGTATGCHKPLFGLVNCCAGKVSGMLTFAAGAAAITAGYSAILGLATQFLALFLCSQEEITLDVKDRMGVCHYVGEYCSEKLLFVCGTIRHTYCCFQTKLARVIQEQGRAQLNKSWGTPKNPDCSGFTVDEFSQLDLSKMDFTEVYGDYTSAVSLPSSLQSATEIQSKIQAYYATHAVK